MKINIASFGGRSHLLDTARELEKFGHEVRFYSYLPTSRAIKFGLKKECNYSLIYLAIPFVVFFRLIGHKEKIYRLYQFIFDFITAWIMKPCDIFIGQSPMHIYSMKYAKKHYDAITILERGTSHVIEQVKALSKNPNNKGEGFMKESYIKRDIEGYNYADYISVGANHVLESFIKHGFSKKRIFVNNYGVDLSQFGPTELSHEIQYDVLMVGGWSYRKGCDLIIEACICLNLKVLHVGSLVDMTFPSLNNFTHIDSVSQDKLKLYYSQAKIFVLPSREEGLALVQVQALACGLPIICSKKSGARDLRKYLISNDYISEMNEICVNDLISCIKIGLVIAQSQSGERSYVKNNLEEVSWVGYGRRYNDFLNSIISPY